MPKNLHEWTRSCWSGSTSISCDRRQKITSIYNTNCNECHRFHDFMSPLLLYDGYWTFSRELSVVQFWIVRPVGSSSVWALWKFSSVVWLRTWDIYQQNYWVRVLLFSHEKQLTSTILKMVADKSQSNLLSSLIQWGIDSMHTTKSMLNIVDLFSVCNISELLVNICIVLSMLFNTYVIVWKQRIIVSLNVNIMNLSDWNFSDVFEGECICANVYLRVYV